MTSSRADADRTALEGSVQSMLRKAYDMGISGSPFDIVDEANRLVDVIEDDLLTTRAEPEPDAERVDVIAKAIHDEYTPSYAHRPWEEERARTEPMSLAYVSRTRNIARVVLQAAGADADEPECDMTLAYMKGYQAGAEEVAWAAVIAARKEADDDAE